MNDPYVTRTSDPRLTPTASIEPPSGQPERIGRYGVQKVLGKGGFGLVYLAYDDQLRRQVAVKVPHAERVARPEDAEAYLTEARTVASLDHASIVPVYDVGSTELFPVYVVSKYIDGTDLAHRLKEGRLSIQEAVELVATVAEALHHAHKQGLVHRDVKPGNILLDKAGKPFVADFGLALRETDLGAGPRYAGTPAYMSPEQARGEGHRVDGRSDIFSLGVVLYELLTGRRPFTAESTEALLDQVVAVEARPPRQLDDAVPRELDRICLKALAKRASERYSAARDLAEDLRHFLDAAPAQEKSALTSRAAGAADVATPPLTPETPAPSDGQLVKIVPKGLRSFDAADADFFLELLPGPRDRDGLPDSIRFWKTRIETMDADNTFAVGLIYGPSGCGKSSLVKAGLLPRLATSVMVIYVEATGEETEARLLKGLRRQVPHLPGDLGLVEALAALRQGRFIKPEQKVLLVLDQFEQWLHAKRNEDNTELVQALRQCDGGRVQAIVMVRDDFWLAVSRFMQALEIRVVEGENSRLVDLFDLRHARKVLTAFGRAFGALPEGELSPEQAAFLDQAVIGLAQDGKVISVRLALFAEMVKGKPWVPRTLREVGGTEGVGVTFLEETFTASTAPPRHRLHQKPAQAVLKALLPASGTDIKGHMRSQQELLAASGYADRPRDFEDLLRILDSEIRLITPTDPEGDDPRLRVSGSLEGSGSPAPPANPQAGNARYYQLTHDYLVPSLRDWLTRKQKETRRGRAELLLADRAAVWNARPENRQLPSLAQWLSIRFWTRKQNWTPPQHKMMRKAGRHHAARGIALALILAVLTAAGLLMQDWFVQQRRQAVAATLVQSLRNADTSQVLVIVRDLPPTIRTWTDPQLHKLLDDPATPAKEKLHASLALLPYDASQVDYLAARLLDAQPHEVAVIREALEGHKDALGEKIWPVARTQGKNARRLRAAAALALFDPQSERWHEAGPALANDLVAENAVHLGHWAEAFRPVQAALLAPLGDIYRDPRPERAAEHALATNLLADYAAGNAPALAGLLMDADEKQFAVIYPAAARTPLAALLAAELEKQPVVLADKLVFETKGKIAEGDAKVKVADGKSLPAQRFEVKLQAGKPHRLTMDSSDLDSFLVLQDRTGKELGTDDDSGGNLNSLLRFTPSADDVYVVFAAALEKTGAFHLKIAETFDAEDGKEKLGKRQANAAVALLRMNQPDKVWPLLKHSLDPRARSYLIHWLASRGADAAAIVKRLDEKAEVTIRRALILSLGEYGEQAIAAADRQALMAKLQDIYRADADPGLHAASEWLLRHWQQNAWLKQANEQWANDREAQEKREKAIKKDLASRAASAAGLPPGPAHWYVNGQGQTMVVISDPVVFLMGSPTTEAGRGDNEPQHKKRIGRSFAIGAKSVTVEQYRKFDKGYNLPAKYTRTADLPVVGTSWFQAAAYCNWLSKQEDIPETEWCYETDARGQVAKLRANYLSLAGYRLPTETEMEYATRAGAITSRYYGETEELLPKYAWYFKNSQEQTWPVGSLKPNDFGLFDAQGNVFTWCQERYREYPSSATGEAADDKEDILGINTDSRVLRGGSFTNFASIVRSANRYIYAPATRNLINGLRPARTFTP